MAAVTSNAKQELGSKSARKIFAIFDFRSCVTDDYAISLLHSYKFYSHTFIGKT